MDWGSKMPTIGRKPAGNDIGFGKINSGNVRGTIVGRVSANGWLYLFGARVGYQPATGTATYAQALYRSSGGTITTKDGESSAVAASGPMDWGGNGVNQTVKPTAPIRVYTGIDYALPIRCATGALAHGMDESGKVMHDRSAGSFPSPLAATDVRPEGALSTWAEIQNNRAPSKPSGLSPANGAFVVSTPTLGADFRDSDETLPGFALGQCDKVSAYTFEIWNAAKTTRLASSGKVSASGANQTSRRVTWTPGALSANTYVARCIVYDLLDTPSPQAEWSFTINAGGATAANIAPASVAGTQDGYPLTNNDGTAGAPVQIQAQWSHSSGLSATEASVRVKATGGSIIRNAVNLAVAITNGGSTTLTINGAAPFAGWAPLTRGTQAIIEVQLKDSAGLWTQWASTGRIVINAAPSTPTSLSPTAGAFSDPPTLSAVIADANDDSATLTASFAVRAQGASGNGALIPSARRGFANGRHTATPNAVELTSKGAWEWRVAGTDPWGLTGTYTAWQPFTYADAPTITVSAPTPGQVFAHGTPTVAFTTSAAMASWRLRVWEAVTKEAAYDAVIVAGGLAGSHQIPAGVLHNAMAYAGEVEVTTTLGLVGRKAISFSISYPTPPALGSITVARAPGPFEAAQPSEHWSQVSVSWPEPSLIDAPAAEFKGYVLRFRAISTGVETRVETIASRGERTFVHRTPTSGEVYAYSVAYLVERNQIDTVESAPVTANGGVSLLDTTICTLDDDALGTPLRFWTARDVEWVTDVTIVPSWTDKPIAFQGRANSDVISGTWQVTDDEHGSYTARDLVAAVREMAGPWIDADGHARPRVICYRDPRGRNAIVALNRGKEADRHITALGEMALAFTEIGVVLGSECEG